MMKRRLLCLAFLALSGLAHAAPRIVTVIDPTEPFEALTLHANHLWVGSSRNNFAADYKLKVFDSNGDSGQEIALSHAMSYIYPYDANSVLIVGTAATPNLTHFTIARIDSNHHVTLTTKVISMEAWAFQWLGKNPNNGKELFLDFSGMTPDEEANRDWSLPARTIFQVSTSPSSSRATPSYWTSRVRMPRLGQVVNSETAFIVSGEAMGSPRTNLQKVNLRDQSVQPVFSEWRNDITDMLQLRDEAGTLVLSESGANQLLFFEPHSSSVTRTLSLSERPRSIAKLGRSCLAVGFAESRKVEIYALNHLDRGPAATIDFSVLGEENFVGIRKIVGSADGRKIFARSAFACSMSDACSPTRNSVAVADVVGLECQ